MTTLAEFMIRSGGDNRLPMLENPLYDSWKSRMELYMENREHGRMILESVEHGVLFKVPYSENTHNDMLNQSVQEMLYFEQTHLVNYPENEITNDSNIIPYSQYLLDTQNAAVQDVKLLEERQNADLSTREKLIMDDIIWEKKAQFVDFEKEINSLKQTLSVQLKENKLLTKTFSVLKNESKEKEAKNIDKEIALEKKVKELDNIVYKMGQSTQTVHMLTKPHVFYDNNLKQALGFQSPFYLKKAQQIRPMLYDGIVIAKETNVISIADLEETLMFEEESRSKMIFKKSDLMVLEKKVNIKPVNYVVLNQLSKDFGKGFCHNNIKNDLRKLKGKNIVDNAGQVSNDATIAPRIEIVKQAKSLNPSDSASYSACKYVKLIQELLGYVRDTFLDIHKLGKKLVVVMPINKKEKIRHELCFLEFVFDMNVCSKSKSVKTAKKKEEWKPIGKVFTKIRYNWRPTGRTFTLVGNACLLTRITATNEVPLRESIPLKVGKITIVTLVKEEMSMWHGNLPRLPISALCYPNNDSETLGKLQAKDDIGPGLQLMTPATSIPVDNAPRAVDLADSHVSMSIDQDAPSIKPKNFKQAMTKPSWIDAMQEEIHEFKRLQV
nr:hypothetical protein [Tanacetum cinerariifolium]